VTYGFHHISGACLAFGANHGGAFAYAAQCLTKITTTTYKGYLKGVFVDVMRFVSRGKHFRFVDIIHADGFQNLGFDKMPNAAFCHDGNGDRIHDLKNELRIAHARHAAISPDICRHPFECHYCHCTGIFSDTGMFGSDYIHDHATLEHLCQAFFHRKCCYLCFHSTKPPEPIRLLV